MVSTTPDSTSIDGDVEHVFDLSQFPSEIAGYATDQFRKAVSSESNQAARELLNYDYVTTEGHSIHVRFSIGAFVLRELLYEKTIEMRDEVECGERDDYALSELDQLVDEVMELEPTYSEGNEATEREETVEKLKSLHDATDRVEDAKAVSKTLELFRDFEGRE